MLARLFEKREIDGVVRSELPKPAHGVLVEPIENTQNREEYLWENLEKLGNSLEKCFLRFNKIKGLVKSYGLKPADSDTAPQLADTVLPALHNCQSARLESRLPSCPGLSQVSTRRNRTSVDRLWLNGFSANRMPRRVGVDSRDKPGYDGKLPNPLRALAAPRCDRTAKTT